MRSPVLLALPALLACNLESDQIVSNGVIVEPTPEGAAVDVEDGAGPVEALVRRVGPWSVALPGAATVDLDVDGLAATADVDAAGYGAVSVDGVGMHQVGGVPVGVTAAPLPEVGVPRARTPPGPVTLAEAGPEGVLLAVGADLWWVGDGLPPHPVARMDAPITELRPVTVDEDGLRDALVLAGDGVLLLRGRRGGGLTWGLGLRAEGWSATGGGVGDLDDDGLQDLVVTWDTGSGTVLQVWAGDGLWGFEPAHERSLGVEIVDLVVGADRGDDRDVVTWISPDGPWQRLVGVDGTFQLTGPPLDIDAGPGFRLLGGDDLDGNGADEIIAMAPRVAGSDREIAIWSLGEGGASHVDLVEPGATLARGDADQDGLTDLILLDDDRVHLQVATWKDDRYLVRDAGPAFDHGLIAAGQLDDDGVVDVVVAADDAWRHWPGRLDTEEGDTRWLPRRPEGTVWPRRLVGDLVPHDDGGVAVTDDGDVTSLTVFDLSGSSPTAAEVIRLDGSAARAPVDLAVCDGEAWVLLDDEVVLVGLDARTVLGRQPVSDPVAVACGDALAGVLDASGLTTLGSAAAVLAVDEAASGIDLALDADGFSPCDLPCTSVVVGEERRVVVGEAGSALGVQDVDGDGTEDVVHRIGGVVEVMRFVDGTALGGWRWHVDPSWSGVPVVGPSPAGGQGLWFRRDANLLVTIPRGG